jgi:hypothetical protein
VITIATMPTPKPPCNEMTTAQQAERAGAWPVLQAFAEAFSEFPQGEAGDCDAPDFIVNTGDTTLGIDVVTLHEDPLADFRNIVVSEAKLLFDDDIDLPLQVRLAGGKTPPSLSDTAQRAATQSLLRQVRANVPLNFGETRLLPYNRFVGTGLFYVTDALSVTRLPKSAPASWAFEGQGEVEADAIAIQHAIDKRQNTTASRLRCDALWLLVGAGHPHIATSFTLSAGVLQHGFVAGHDRLFFFDGFTQRVDELTCAPR